MINKTQPHVPDFLKAEKKKKGFEEEDIAASGERGWEVNDRKYTPKTG